MTLAQDGSVNSDQGALARGIKRPWLAVPAAVRAQVERELGSRVTSAATQAGGFSPGVAARLLLANGQRAFIKAIGPEPNPDSPAFYRQEAAIIASLPAGIAPRLLTCFEYDRWVVLLFEDIDGRMPQRPWQADELRRVLDALVDLAHALTPAPASVRVPSTVAGLGDDFHGWRRLESASARGEELGWLDPWARRNLARLADEEARWEQAASGDSLVHCDLRADNLLLTDDRVYIVDWSSACLAQAWLDLVFMLPSVRLDGGPQPEAIASTHPLTEAADPKAVTTVVAALTGYFIHQSHRPAPAGLPTVRAFQRAQGEISLEWLQVRTGWH